MRLVEKDETVVVEYVDGLFNFCEDIGGNWDAYGFAPSASG